jgi:hypothetical protein
MKRFLRCAQDDKGGSPPRTRPNRVEEPTFALLAANEVEQTSSQNDLSLPLAQIVLYRKFKSMGQVPNLQESSRRQGFADSLDLEFVMFVQAVVICLVLEDQGQNPEVH